MDWMYDGMKIQKEDYLLGKKVDKHLNKNEDNGNLLNCLYHIFNVLFCYIFIIIIISNLCFYK